MYTVVAVGDAEDAMMSNDGMKSWVVNYSFTKQDVISEPLVRYTNYETIELWCDT
jgi:hypothetical protein